MMSLKSVSEFELKEYRYDSDPTTPDSVHLILKKGGFRTITGLVSDSENDSYILETPQANVDVRGTTFECVIQSGATFCGTYNGGTTVSNSQGAVNLGLGAAHDYVRVPQNMPPEPLMQQPPQLGQSQFNMGNNQNQSTPTSTTQNLNAVPVIRTRSGASTLSPASGATPSNGPSFPAPTPITEKPYKAGNNP